MEGIVVGQEGTVSLVLSGSKLGSSGKDESKNQIHYFVRQGFIGGTNEKNQSQLGVEAQTCNCSTQETETGGHGVPAWPGYTVDCISKQTRSRRGIQKD